MRGPGVADRGRRPGVPGVEERLMPTALVGVFAAPLAVTGVLERLLFWLRLVKLLEGGVSSPFETPLDPPRMCRPVSPFDGAASVAALAGVPECSSSTTSFPALPLPHPLDPPSPPHKTGVPGEEGRAASSLAGIGDLDFAAANAVGSDGDGQSGALYAFSGPCVISKLCSFLRCRSCTCVVAAGEAPATSAALSHTGCNGSLVQPNVSWRTCSQSVTQNPSIRVLSLCRPARRTFIVDYENTFVHLKKMNF